MQLANGVVAITDIPPTPRNGRKPTADGPTAVLAEVMELPEGQAKLILCDTPQKARVKRNDVMTAARRKGMAVRTRVSGRELYVWRVEVNE
jgi:hypothetical protein